MSNPVAVSLTLVENVPAPKDGEHCSGCDESFLHEYSYECNGFVIHDPTKIVERWHNDTHRGGFRFCDLQPCHAINWAVDR